LLHNKSIIGSRLRPRCILIFFIFCRSIRRPKQWDNVPHTFCPVASPLQRPPHRQRHLSVGCCVPPSNGGHLRPMVRPSIYFFFRLIRPPKRRAAVLPTRSDPASSPLLQRTL
jgi:hypothetical protein